MTQKEIEFLKDMLEHVKKQQELLYTLYDDRMRVTKKAENQNKILQGMMQSNAMYISTLKNIIALEKLPKIPCEAIKDNLYPTEWPKK